VSSFDLVCHQRLTAKLAERVSDRLLLVLIRRMLKAKVVLPDGVVTLGAPHSTARVAASRNVLASAPLPLG